MTKRLNNDHYPVLGTKYESDGEYPFNNEWKAQANFVTVDSTVGLDNDNSKFHVFEFLN